MTEKETSASGQCSPEPGGPKGFMVINHRRILYLFQRAPAQVCDWLLDRILKLHPGAKGNITAYAEEELRRAGWFKEDGLYGDMMGKAVMRQVRLFSIEGHSGMSAGIASNLAQTVCMFRPLTPLTGEDDEWGEPHDNEGTQQNKRFSAIFRKKDGSAYNIEGRVFREPNGATYTSRDSRLPVTFPWTYTPPVVVDVGEDE